MKLYQVWTEGYSATGESGTATFHGEVEAETFLDACKLILGNRESFSVKQCWVGTWGQGHELYEDIAHLWGCRCFDNEADARKNFG